MRVADRRRFSFSFSKDTARERKGVINTNQQTDIELMSEWRWNRRPHLVKGKGKERLQREGYWLLGYW
jgi:hypothetical protein